MIYLGDDIKPCPRCQVLIVKMDDGSCNHMTCAFCGAEFCWLCMKEISDLHYLRYYMPNCKYFRLECVNLITYFSIVPVVLLAALFGEKSRGHERKKFCGNLEL